MIHWKCRMILSKKVNTNCMKLNNGYQSSLSSLSTSLNIYFFILVSKAALVDWLWLKLLTSTLINGYPKSSMVISSMLSDIILPETINVLWVYTLSMYYGERSAVMWNRKLCWRWTCLPSAMPEIEVFRLQPSEKILWRGFQEVFTRRPSSVPKDDLPPHLEYLPKCRLHYLWGQKSKSCSGCWSIQSFLSQKAFCKAIGVGKKCSLHPKAIPCTVKQAVGLFSRQHIQFHLRRENQGQSIKTVIHQ